MLAAVVDVAGNDCESDSNSDCASSDARLSVWRNKNSVIGRVSSKIRNDLRGFVNLLVLPGGGAHGEMLLVFNMLPTVTNEPLELTFIGIGCCNRTEFCGLSGFKPRNFIACT